MRRLVRLEIVSPVTAAIKSTPAMERLEKICLRENDCFYTLKSGIMMQYFLFSLNSAPLGPSVYL